MPNRYLEALGKHEDSVAKNVTSNLYERRMNPLFAGLSKTAFDEAAVPAQGTTPSP